MVSVMVGYAGQLPSLPKQKQPASQIGTTFLDKTFPFVCTGACIIETESSCNISTDTLETGNENEFDDDVDDDVDDFDVTVVISFMIAIAIAVC